MKREPEAGLRFVSDEFGFGSSCLQAWCALILLSFLGSFLISKEKVISGGAAMGFVCAWRLTGMGYMTNGMRDQGVTQYGDPT